MSAEKAEKVIRDVELKPQLVEQIRKEVVRASYITPQSLAMKYNIRVSVARKLLREFEREGIVVYVDGNSRLRIYMGARAKVSKEG
ncbi:MAG: 30S ribosomal protein S25e [Candidatus Korarchaeota archaeon NZ13-K]|nr:MAG: 30S ribosomal protein S25e [Candidatus Korarchaeota archaeon NZ13-K]